MLTYSDKSTLLVLESTVAVFVVMNAQGDDVEFLPLKPQQMSDGESAELHNRWAGRGLRSAGVIGLEGTSVRCEFKEHLDAETVSALGAAFAAYLQALFSDSFAAQQPRAEVQELVRLWSLEDPRHEV